MEIGNETQIKYLSEYYMSCYVSTKSKFPHFLGQGWFLCLIEFNMCNKCKDNKNKHLDPPEKQLNLSPFHVRH